MTFFHASNSDLPIGKSITWKGSKKHGTFGDYEKILEATRPNNANSRLSSFYVTNSKATAKWYSDNVYVVEIAPNTPFHYLGWISALMNLVEKTGYSETGYVVPGWKSKIKEEDVQVVTQAYWSGLKPSKSDLKVFNTNIDAETYQVEFFVQRNQSHKKGLMQNLSMLSC